MSDPPAPAQADASRRRGTLAWTSSTYFAEGLPWSVLHQIAAEFLTAVGMRPAQVGYTSFLHATNSLKFLWSPAVDMVSTLRSWMVGMQALMGIAIGALAVVAHALATGPDPASADPTWIWALLVVIGVLSATHDIACDGYYMDALDKPAQARYSGVRVAAFRAAMLVGSSGLVFIGGSINWLLGFGAAAAIMGGLALAHRIWLPPGAGDHHGIPHKRKNWEHVKEAYLSFLTMDKAMLVIAFIMTYKLADVLMFSMSKVLLDRELGVPTDLRGIVNTFSIGGSIVGAVIGGAWIARKSLAQTLFVITVLMAITEPLYILLAASTDVLAVAVPGTAQSIADLDWSVAGWRIVVITGTVVIEQVCGGLATAAQMVFLMRRCHPDHKAAHFAFGTAIYSVAQMLVGGLSGHVYEAFGSVIYFTIVSALTLPAVILARVVPKD